MNITDQLATEGEDEVVGRVRVQSERREDGGFYVVAGPYKNPREHGKAMAAIAAALNAGQSGAAGDVALWKIEPEGDTCLVEHPRWGRHVFHAPFTAGQQESSP